MFYDINFALKIFRHGLRSLQGEKGMKTEANSQTSVRKMILAALSHSEAEEGLYFRNFTSLHHEDQRPKVEAPEELVLDELNALIREGKVKVGYDQLEPVFMLA